MLPSHYAPRLPVRLDATEARPGEALLAFGPDAPPGFAEVLWLSRSGDLAEAAANLFAMLRRLDRPSFTGIAVMPIPEHGLGRAINDRLRRAAAPARQLTQSASTTDQKSTRHGPEGSCHFFQHIFIRRKILLSCNLCRSISKTRPPKNLFANWRR